MGNDAALVLRTGWLPAMRISWYFVCDLRFPQRKYTVLRVTRGRKVIKIHWANLCLLVTGSFSSTHLVSSGLICILRTKCYFDAGFQTPAESWVASALFYLRMLTGICSTWRKASTQNWDKKPVSNTRALLYLLKKSRKSIFLRRIVFFHTLNSKSHRDSVKIHCFPYKIAPLISFSGAIFLGEIVTFLCFSLDCRFCSKNISWMESFLWLKKGFVFVFFCLMQLRSYLTWVEYYHCIFLLKNLWAWDCVVRSLFFYTKWRIYI